ncbi:MAG TPA: hypothetical protein PLJ38_02630, partial [bacterium]|nr:hypothetical protein [bacterium]
FSSYNNGWAVGDNGNIYFTAPNPANWQKLDIPNYPHTFDFNKIFMYENQDTIFIFGDNGYYFMRTFDYTQSDQQLSRFIISDAGGPYFTTIDETVALSAERTIARNKNFLRYRWTKLNNTENAQITDADKMTAVFSADTSGVYFVKLAVDDYRGNYSETFTKICVIDTFINLVSNDTFVTFRNSAALKFNNNNLLDVSLRLRNDFNDLTITINRVDYAETPYILFINRAQSQFLPVIRPNISLYEDLSYTILDFELFDLKTKNNLNRQTFAFDNLRINYALAPNIDNFKNRSFAIFKLDDNYRNWSKIGGDYLYSIDNGIANISTDLQHFSIYALFSIPYFDNDDIFVYPNPFIPNDGNIKTGRHYTGADDGSGIYFSGKKMANAKITIVNLAGFVVFEQRNTNKNYFQWNVSDKKGNRAASGFYYVIIEADDYKCIKKLQIVN